MKSFKLNMEAAKETLGTLSVALLRGDWDKFTAGIFNANKALLSTTKTLARLEISYGYVHTEAAAAIAEMQEVVSDPDAPKEQKMDILAETRKILDESKRLADETINNSIKKITETVDAKGFKKTNEEILDLIKNYNNYIKIHKAEEERLKAVDAYEDAKKVVKNPHPGPVYGKAKETVKNAENNPESLIQKYTKTELETAKLAFPLGNKGVGNIAELEGKINETKRTLSRFERQYNRALKSVEKPEKHGKPGSPAYLEEKLKDLEEKEKYETDVDVRLKLQFNQKVVKNQLANLNKEVESGLSKSVTGKPILDNITDISQDVSEKMSDSLYASYQKVLGKSVTGKLILDGITYLSHNAGKKMSDSMYASYQKVLGKMGQADLKLEVTPMVPTIEHLKESLKAIQDELKKQHPLEILAKLAVEKEQTEGQIEILEEDEKAKDKAKERAKKGQTYGGASEVLEADAAEIASSFMLKRK
jgi:uncharacterized membrane protein YfbV (UPF0208 family)